MAFVVDPGKINPALLRAMTSAVRILTNDELAALRQELASDPEKTGYRTATGDALKGAHDLASLLNSSGRAQALFGDVLLEAADVLLAVQGVAEAA